MKSSSSVVPTLRVKLRSFWRGLADESMCSVDRAAFRRPCRDTSFAGHLALDEKGFIKTGPDLTPEDFTAAQWPLERAPYLLETSRPGVFAVGDVRCGNIKRVASAVGEGSIAISFVHRVLAD